jgi:hypothetical protein
VAEIYHRTAAGKVVWIDAMTRDEVADAIEAGPRSMERSLDALAK